MRHDLGVCTVTWLRTDAGFELFCNRDERHERAAATPPATIVRDGVALLAPRDPDGGGTWLAVNELGVAVCLLNGYRAGDDLLPAERFRSRGLLVLEIAARRDAAAVAGALAATDLAPYRSFDLLALDAAGPRVLSWDRASARLNEAAAGMPLVSCPVRTDEVRAARAATLQEHVARRGTIDTALLAAYHRSRHPEGWIWSVSMHHDKAATRSLSHVRVTAGEIAYAYVPGRPCETPPLPAVTLSRRR